MKPGAEATVKKKGNKVIKHRIKKSYRHPILDKKLRQQRTNREAKILTMLEKIDFPGPKLTKQEKDKLHLTYLDGAQLKGLKLTKPVLTELGKKIAILHNNDIIHGDLTTSNIILTNQIHLIDFGLAKVSKKPEDKATDLNLLLREVDSPHLLDSYFKEVKTPKIIKTTLEKVQKRGRNKH